MELFKCDLLRLLYISNITRCLSILDVLILFMWFKPINIFVLGFLYFILLSLPGCQKWSDDIFRQIMPFLLAW